MPQEKATELFQWKNKLEDIDYLPGEPPFNKNSAWQRLHHRLDKKPRASKIIWYWLAAACLAAVVSLPFLVSDRKKPDVVVTDKPSPALLPSNTTETMNRLHNDTIQSPVVFFDKQQARKSKNSRQNSTEKKIEVYRIPEITVPDSSSIPKNEVVVVERSFIDTSFQLIAAPIKKKLSVVHLNELESETRLRAEYLVTDINRFRGVRTKKSRSSSVIVGRNASDDIVKIKISPSN